MFICTVLSRDEFLNKELQSQWDSTYGNIIAVARFPSERIAPLLTHTKSDWMCCSFKSPVPLGKSHGQRSLMGYSSGGRKESQTRLGD